MCELDPHSSDSCILTSPQNVHNDAVASSCMKVDFVLSDYDDVILIADFFVGNDKVISVVQSKAYNHDYIRLSDLPSIDFVVTFTAKRNQTSKEVTQTARIDRVQLEACPDDVGTYYDYRRPHN